MVKQLAHVEELSSRDRVTIQVVRLDAGYYPGLAGPFTLLEFTDDDPVIYLENRIETVTREDPQSIGQYLDSFQTMENKIASKPQEFGELIQTIIR